MGESLYFEGLKISLKDDDIAFYFLGTRMLSDSGIYIDNKVQNAKEFIDSFVHMPISDPILMGTILIYADREMAEDEREHFLEEYAYSPKCDFLKKAIIEILAAIIAADEIESNEVFYEVIRLLDTPEEDEVVFKLKQAMLRNMIRDASDYLSHVDEERFLAHMLYIERLLMQTA